MFKIYIAETLETENNFLLMPKHAQKHKNAMKKSIAEKWPIVVFQLSGNLDFIEFLPPKCFTKLTTEMKY